MSVASQFFPSGSTSGGGGGTNIGGGTIPVEIVGMAGGGGGGGGCCQPNCRASGGGPGGDGGYFNAINYYLNPGTTYPITIGGGGSGGGLGTQGSNGTHTSFNNPLCPIRVEGGGGGGGGTSPYCSPYCRAGLPGGSGGGAGSPSGQIGQGLYFTKCVNSRVLTQSVSGNIVSGPAQGTVRLDFYNTLLYGTPEPITCPWGCMSGFPGSPAVLFCSSNLPACAYCGGCGGRTGGNPIAYCVYVPYGPTNCITRGQQIDSGYIYSSITGNSVGYGETIGTRGNGATGSFSGTSGCAGALIIKWPSSVGAAPPTGFPGGTDISPQTPGYYTYCFTSSGSITLP
jgi:hypothetical protein